MVSSSVPDGERRSLRVAIISLYLPSGLVGGVPLQVHQLANALVERGHEVTAFSYYGPPVDARYAVRRVRLTGLAARLVGTVPALRAHLVPIALGAEDYDSFDVVHAHGDSHFVSTSAPIVRTFHSSGFDQALYANTWKGRVGMLALYPFDILSGLRARRRVFVSAAQRRYLPFGGKVIHNGTDLTVFGPGGDRATHPTVLFVAGTIRGRKRGAALIEQFTQHVLPQLPDAELWMACPERVDAPGVRPLGVLGGSALADAYRQSWVFCLPSRWESFGIPYVEAMACGTPVVATPNVGAREVLDGGRFGALTSERTLGDTLLALLRDPERCRRLGDAGLRRAREFSLEAMVDRYEALYRELALTRARTFGGLEGAGRRRSAGRA